jgi:hypothetical protein
VVKVPILLACLVLASVAAHAGTVMVTFVQPEKFTDATLDGDNRMVGRQPVLNAIRTYLEALGTKDLKPNETLAIEVTDIDLAGRCEPWRPIGNAVRIMRDVDPPSMKLHYKLTDGTRVLAEGQEALVNVNYLDEPLPRSQQEPLRYDKAMLHAWVQRLVRGHPA